MLLDGHMVMPVVEVHIHIDVTKVIKGVEVLGINI